MSAEEEPLRSSLGKRRRVDADDSDPASASQSSNQDSEFVPSTDVWFDDGNIIVRAGPGLKGPGLIWGFKCHKSVLASRSAFFESMFALPQTAENVIDGVPYVDFTDDWKDVWGFLRMLYGSLIIPVKERHCGLTSVIAGALRLATKYEATSVSRQLQQSLERDWPDDYEQWIVMQEKRYLEYVEFDRAAVNKRDDLNPGTGIPMLRGANFECAEPARVVALAEELRLTKVLRAAYYEAARSWASEASPRDPTFYVRGRLSRREMNVSLLGEQEMRRLIIGRERIKLAVLDFVDELDGSIDEYTRGFTNLYPTCAGAMIHWWGEVKGGQHLLELVQDPLGELLRMQRTLRSSDGEQWPVDSTHNIWGGKACNCGDHKRWVDKQLWRKGKDIWDLLPEMFFDLDVGSEV